MTTPINTRSFSQKICPLSADKNDRVNRKKNLHRRNLASSLEDPIFPNLQGFSEANKSRLRNLTALAKKYLPAINNHHYDRVTAFFYAAVSIYKLGYTFTLGQTQEQAESASRLPGICERNACHSSLTPSLLVEGRPFMPGSDLFHILNRTNALPRQINMADACLERKVRQVAINILNESSKGILTPFEATKKLVRICGRFLSANQGNVILRIYFECNQSIEKKWCEDDLLLLLGLKINNRDDQEKILEKRMQVIQKKHLLQTEIYQRLTDAVRTILKNDKKPPYFDDAIIYALISLVKERDRIRLCKLFLIPPKEYYFKGDNRRSTMIEKNLRFLIGCKEVRFLAIDILELMAHQRRKIRQIQRRLQEELRGGQTLAKRISDDSIRKWCIKYNVHESAFFSSFFYT